MMKNLDKVHYKGLNLLRNSQKLSLAIKHLIAKDWCIYDDACG